MLFDLRGRGRRRTVQAVYLGLALLMGGGLILFGVGAGNGNGGFLNAFTNNGSGGNQSSVVSQQERNALREIRQNQTSPTAWSDLINAYWINAGQGSNYNASTGQFTDAGRRQLALAVKAWQHYQTLTKSPDSTTATLAARSAAGIADYKTAAGAWQIMTLSNPSAPKGFECMALASYAAKNNRVGDLAAQKAVALVPKSQQFDLGQQLKQAKPNAATVLPGAC
jgi:hypothetical protein